MIEIRLADDYWADTEADTEALLEKWLVEPGARVVAGQALANVALVKTSIEIEAPCAGTIAALLVEAENTFPRTRALALLQE